MFNSDDVKNIAAVLNTRNSFSGCSITHTHGESPGTLGITDPGDDDEHLLIKVSGELINFAFLELPEILYGSGVRSVELYSWGWWIGTGSAPESVRVTDHIACGKPNPLTGSIMAAKGMAFVNMRDAYSKSVQSKFNPGHLYTGDKAVLWHTSGRDKPSETEISEALNAGCTVMSPDVVPWSVGFRAVGLKMSAWVRLQP